MVKLDRIYNLRENPVVISKYFQTRVKHLDMKNSRAMFCAKSRGTAVKTVCIGVNFMHVLAGT